MNRIVQHLSNLTNQLIPNQCLLCAQTLTGELLCSGCLCDLPYLDARNICQQCGLDLQGRGSFCGACLQHPPAFSHSLIPFAYDGLLAPLIHKFKYRRQLSCGKLLGQLLADHLRHCADSDPHWQSPDLIIPTPMHWLRRWQRGYNQAEILAAAAADALAIPVNTTLLQRTRRAQTQKELNRAERQKNLRGAFRIRANKLIRGKRIALVDDVVTTTATMREISSTLVKAGALDVQVWALARTL